MSEITLAKKVNPNEVRYGETFNCIDCGDDVVRGGATHFRCPRCAREATLGIRSKKIAHYFPVVRDDMAWLPSYLLSRDEDDTDRAREVGIPKRDRPGEWLESALNIKSPCGGCGNAPRCRDQKLMCKAFYVWADGRKSKNGWGKRIDPSRKYYKMSFPNDKEESTTSAQQRARRNTHPSNTPSKVGRRKWSSLNSENPR